MARYYFSSQWRYSSSLVVELTDNEEGSVAKAILVSLFSRDVCHVLLDLFKFVPKQLWILCGWHALILYISFKIEGSLWDEVLLSSWNTIWQTLVVRKITPFITFNSISSRGLTPFWQMAPKFHPLASFYMPKLWFREALSILIVGCKGQVMQIWDQSSYKLHDKVNGWWGT